MAPFKQDQEKSQDSPQYDIVGELTQCSMYDTVTVNTIPGFMRNSAPLWVSGQDASLVILGLQVQAQPMTLWFIC